MGEAPHGKPLLPEAIGAAMEVTKWLKARPRSNRVRNFVMILAPVGRFASISSMLKSPVRNVWPASRRFAEDGITKEQGGRNERSFLHCGASLTPERLEWASCLRRPGPPAPWRRRSGSVAESCRGAHMWLVVTPSLDYCGGKEFHRRE